MSNANQPDILFFASLVHQIVNELSARVVTVSNAVKAHLVGITPTQKVVTIYNGTDAESSRALVESPMQISSS